MTKIDIISGFLGAGKTTLIKKLIEQAFKGEKLVLIENEFGEIGIDGGFLKDAGVQITEMNSGCICCSLVGDFGTALKQVITDYTPDRIIIEPSGVGKLSDVIKAVKDVAADLDVELDSYTTVADVSKVKIYMKNFGEFFNNQIESANTIILSRTQTTTQDKIEKAVAMIREKNDHATIITTPWDELDGAAIREAMQNYKSLEETMMDEAKSGHDHEHDHGDDCTCGCHDHDHHHDHDHDHEHHDHDHEDHSHCDHEHGVCNCGHHHDDDEDEYGIGTFVYHSRRPFSQEKLQEFVNHWPKSVVRAKGIVWFDDQRDSVFVFEQAGVQISATEQGKWLTAFPKEQQELYLKEYPEAKKNWDDVYGDREIKLVFIGQHMDKEKITADLDKCVTQ